MNWFWLLMVFYIGFQSGRWDAKHGAEYGYKAGVYTREHIFNEATDGE